MENLQRAIEEYTLSIQELGIALRNLNERQAEILDKSIKLLKAIGTPLYTIDTEEELVNDIKRITQHND